MIQRPKLLKDFRIKFVRDCWNCDSLDEFIAISNKYRLFCAEHDEDPNGRIFGPEDAFVIEHVYDFYDKKKVTKDFHEWFKKAFDPLEFPSFKSEVMKTLHWIKSDFCCGEAYLLYCWITIVALVTYVLLR